MVCLGGIYGFSIFVPPLKAEYGLTTAQTQRIFGFTVISFAVSMIFSGRLLKKLNPKLVASIDICSCQANTVVAIVNKLMSRILQAGCSSVFIKIPQPCSRIIP